MGAIVRVLACALMLFPATCAFGQPAPHAPPASVR